MVSLANVGFVVSDAYKLDEVGIGLEKLISHFDCGVNGFEATLEKFTIKSIEVEPLSGGQKVVQVGLLALWLLSQELS